MSKSMSKSLNGGGDANELQVGRYLMYIIVSYLECTKGSFLAGVN